MNQKKTFDSNFHTHSEARAAAALILCKLM